MWSALALLIRRVSFGSYTQDSPPQTLRNRRFRTLSNRAPHYESPLVSKPNVALPLASLARRSRELALNLMQPSAKNVPAAYPVHVPRALSEMEPPPSQSLTATAADLPTSVRAHAVNLRFGSHNEWQQSVGWLPGRTLPQALHSTRTIRQAAVVLVCRKDGEGWSVGVAAGFFSYQLQLQTDWWL